VEPEENESNVAAFLADHPDARRVDGFDERPARDHDGGYAAAFLRG
jgi:16S rRNA C967 or C1407 C5-methylase (RsmB/RsmF family)